MMVVLNRGYSLIEVIMVLACFLVLSAFCVHRLPGMQSFSVKSELSRVLSILQFARSYAVLNQKAVTVCGSEDGLQCDGSWSKNILLQLHAQRLTVFRTRLPLNGRLSWSGGGRRNVLKFNARGDSLGFQGRFKVCHTRLNKCTCLVVSPSGMLRNESNCVE